MLKAQCCSCQTFVRLYINDTLKKRVVSGLQQNGEEVWRFLMHPFCLHIPFLFILINSGPNQSTLGLSQKPYSLKCFHSFIHSFIEQVLLNTHCMSHHLFQKVLLERTEEGVASSSWKRKRGISNCLLVRWEK